MSQASADPFWEASGAYPFAGLPGHDATRQKGGYLGGDRLAGLGAFAT